MAENTETIAVNQQMISEWAAECLADNYHAMFMVCMDTTEPDVMKSIRLFSSDGMPIPGVIRNLRHVADMLEQANYAHAAAVKGKHFK